MTSDSMILLNETHTPLGQIQMGLDVDYDTSELIVLVIQGKRIQLPNSESGDVKGSIEDFNLYVCVDLLHTDDVISSAKTKVCFICKYVCLL